MKKINKTPAPNELTQYAQTNHYAELTGVKWENFKNHNGGSDYRSIRTKILDDQGGLCAYCETSIINLPPHKQRVEHFHSKSDSDDPNKNWALDWNNVICVCIGGDDSDKQLHPLPENLSCDSHKNHLINRKKFPQACEGYLLNPLLISAFPSLFDLDKATCELKPNSDVCQKVEINNNQMGTTQALVQNTIDILNLNCDRLTQDRRAVLNSYNQWVTKARKQNDKQCFNKMASCWFQTRWTSFFTTRRILLGNHAETYLKQIQYNG